MGEKDFGCKFPTKGKSSGGGKPKQSPAMPTSGRPKAKKDNGDVFPKTTRPGGESKYGGK
jgi:hypothetical protein